MKHLLRLHAGKVSPVRNSTFANTLMFTLCELKDIPFGEWLKKKLLSKAMKHWKVLLVTTVGREEMAKTFWPWWQPFNSLFFGTFTLSLCFPFFFLLLKKVCVFACVCLCMYVCVCVCLCVWGEGACTPTHLPSLWCQP